MQVTHFYEGIIPQLEGQSVYSTGQKLVEEKEIQTSFTSLKNDLVSYPVRSGDVG